MKVAVYARVSTDEQAKKYSIPAHLDLPRNHPQINVLGVFKEYWRETELIPSPLTSPKIWAELR